MVGNEETATGVASPEIAANILNSITIRAFLNKFKGNALSCGSTSGDQDIITKVCRLIRYRKGDLDEIRFYLDGW